MSLRNVSIHPEGVAQRHHYQPSKDTPLVLSLVLDKEADRVLSVARGCEALDIQRAELERVTVLDDDGGPGSLVRASYSLDAGAEVQLSGISAPS